MLTSRGMDDSLGRFYAAITSFWASALKEAEYKVMGLAPYGKTLINFEPFIKLTDDDYSIDSSFFRGYGKSSGRDSANSSLVSRFEPWYSSKLVDLLGSPRHLGVEMNQYTIEMSLFLLNITLKSPLNGLLRHILLKPD